MSGMDEIKEKITKFKQEEPHIKEVTLYDMSAGEILATTHTPKMADKIVDITKIVLETDKEANSISNVGRTHWHMYSFAKEVIARVRIKKNTFVQVEYTVETAPSSAIEDALELGLMINDLM